MSAPLPPLPDAVRAALPASTPAPPWPCRVEAGGVLSGARLLVGAPR